MNAIPDHYAALGIDPTADPEVIAAAYRALAKKFHPDTGATAGTASPERFEQVQRAYEVLRTPESRRQYDLELLAQAERDLEEHLARKRRALPGAVGVPPDLGTIRPEPAGTRAHGQKPGADSPDKERRSLAPFLIPALLLLVLVGAGTWLFLPRPFDAPSKTVAEQTKPVAETPPAQTPEMKPAADAAPSTPDTSAVAEAAPQPAPKADAEPAPASAPAATAAGDAAEAPVFGSSEAEAAQAEPAAEPALTTAGPATPAPAPKPRPAKPKPAAAAAPRQQAQSSHAYTLIIYERRRHGRIVTQQADMLFASRGSCVEFGVEAVLRRMEARNMNPRRKRIWYECQPAS